MKLHSDILTNADLYAAAAKAGSGVQLETQYKGSRSRANAWDVSLTGTSFRRPNSGNYGASGDVYAATWDEWGMFFGALFEIDPNMTCRAYSGTDDFNFQTGSRFLTLTPEEQCKNHAWEFQGTNVTGAYHLHECRKCEAIRRHMTR